MAEKPCEPCDGVVTVVETDSVSSQQVFEDEHVRAIGLVKTVCHPTAGDIKLVGPAVLYSEGGNFVRLPPPLLGQHTVEVLESIAGYSDSNIKSLREAHVIN